MEKICEYLKIFGQNTMIKNFRKTNLNARNTIFSMDKNQRHYLSQFIDSFLLNTLWLVCIPSQINFLSSCHIFALIFLLMSYLNIIFVHTRVSVIVFLSYYRGRNLHLQKNVISLVIKISPILLMKQKLITSICNLQGSICEHVIFDMPKVKSAILLILVCCDSIVSDIYNVEIAFV